MNKFASHSLPVILRLVLYRGEVYRLPRACRQMRVRSGAAWVSFDGQDLVLACGEEARLAPGKDFAVVSGVGRAPLILEILGDGRQPSFSVLGSALNPAAGNRPTARPSRVD
jgi:hypothetical protein